MLVLQYKLIKQLTVPFVKIDYHNALDWTVMHWQFDGKRAQCCSYCGGMDYAPGTDEKERIMHLMQCNEFKTFFG